MTEATEALRPDNNAARILVAEDEFLVAALLAGDLGSRGWTVLGPYRDIETTAEAIRREAFDFAVLDVNLQGKYIYPVADELIAAKKPFLLLSGYRPEDLPPRFAAVAQVGKPYDQKTLIRAVEQGLPKRA